jgi:hypothetical protein
MFHNEQSRPVETEIAQQLTSAAVSQLKTLQRHEKDSPGLRSAIRMHRKVRSRVPLSFS